MINDRKYFQYPNVMQFKSHLLGLFPAYALNVIDATSNVNKLFSYYSPQVNHMVPGFVYKELVQITY